MMQCETLSYGRAFCPSCGGCGSEEVGQDENGAFGRGECPECEGKGRVNIATLMIAKPN